MENKFSPYLCGSRKNHNVQYSFLKMIENVEKVRVIFMEHSKTFGLINYS